MVFDTPPIDFQPKFEVVGCFMEHDGDILLLQRNDDKSEGGRWGIPGGKRGPGETLAQALVREIKEETGVTILESELQYHQPILVRHTLHDFTYHIFSTVLRSRPEITLSPLEHQAQQWTTPAHALKLNLVTDKNACIKIRYGIEA